MSISVQHISKSYQKVDALKDISFEEVPKCKNRMEK